MLPRFTLDIEGSAFALPGRSFSLLTRLNKPSPWRPRHIPRMMVALLGTFQKKGRTASMRIDGVWHLCDDGIVRPVIRGEILAEDGSWVKAPFLVDSAADRTVFSADVLEALHLQAIDSPDRLSGVGGVAASVVVETQIRLTHDQAGKAIFKGQFAGFTEVEALDMSVLGRDLLNLFALIIDRQGDTICLLGQGHSYTIGKR